MSTGSDEARSAFTTSAPDFSLSEIEALVAARYGLTGRASFLTSERDLTVRIDASGGESFVLKIANAAEDPAVSEFQNRALEHLERVAPDVPASRLVPTVDGASEFLAEKHGQPHFTRLLTWLPGRPLFGTPQTMPQMRALGAALGQLAKALSSFRHPAADHEIVWDLRRVPQLIPLTAHVGDDALRGRVEAAFLRFRDEILPLAPGFRTQVVHNDFNPFNLLVAPDDSDRLTGILDFGDLVSTSAIYDLAIACAYQVAEDGPPLAFVAELLAGYHAVHPMPEAEVDHLFDLIAARHAMTITIGEWRASRYPDNAAYILRNHARARAAMTRCATLPRAEARAILRRACGYA